MGGSPTPPQSLWSTRSSAPRTGRHRPSGSAAAAASWRGSFGGHSHGGHHWRWCSLPQGQTDAALGLTPRQHSSGDKQRLYGITKRGDAYLRTLLIHGTRAVVSQAKHREDRLSRWVTAIAKRHHTNVAAVALPNKTARIAWTMLRTGADYDPNLTAA